ncbi:MAG: SMP-30/gluconolactonase/LRE family protein [Trueperaceae bacterium]
MRTSIFAFLIVAFGLVPCAAAQAAAPSQPLMAQARVPAYEVAVLVGGSPIHGANGLYFGPDGHLYVASVLGMELVVLDPDSGEVVDRLGAEAGVAAPDDVTFGPDGSLYWTDILTGEVGRRTPAGAVTKQFVAMGVNPITFSDDGRLFVALDFLGDALFELDPDLTGEPRPIIVASEANPYPLGFMNGFDFGPDGRLYGPLYAAHLVVSLDVDACDASSDPWADCDLRMVADGFQVPVAAKFDAQGRLHVLDDPTGEVFVVDVTTGEKTLVVALPPQLDNLAFDADGALYVSNYGDGSVVRVRPTGGYEVVNAGGLVAPQGLAVVRRPDGTESLFVADHFTLREFDGLSGRQRTARAGLLVGEGMTAPTTVASDGEHLVLSSLLTAAVQVWDPTQADLVAHHAFPAPLNAIRFQGDLVVADLGLGGVVWASTGEVILVIDQQQVWLPAGLATDGERLWVADWATGIVWQLDFDGRTPSAPVPIAADLANPEGLALDHDGSLLVVEAGAGRLSRIDLATGAVQLVADGLALGLAGPTTLPPTFFFSGIAVDASGAIYVSGDIDRVIYRIDAR